MVLYYHISRGIQESTFLTNYNKKTPVFFAKKNTFWNKVEKEIGYSAEYGGYREYKLYINKNKFTESLDPIEKDKILRVTKHNVKEIKKIIKLNRPRQKWINKLRRKYIGIDFHDAPQFSKFTTDELLIFNILPFLKDIRLVDIKIYSPNKMNKKA